MVHNCRSIITQGGNGGKECDENSLRQTIPCKTFCMNGGTLSDDKCICLTGWEGDCCENGNLSLRLLSLVFISYPISPHPLSLIHSLHFFVFNSLVLSLSLSLYNFSVSRIFLAQLAKRME